MPAADKTIEIQVMRRDLRTTRVVERASDPLADGEVRVEVEKFALTANNVSYGVSGSMLGYWQYYPAEEPWGVLPVWGFARVVESRAPNLLAGRRIWGFLPMASHAVLRPADITASTFRDDSPHRRDLPSVYNAYQRTDDEPAELAAMEHERCLLFPLFSTSYLLRDWLEDNGYFGARQVVIASASSKTGLGLANLLAREAGHPVQVVGLTSASNRAFVEGLGTCDVVRSYEEIASLDASLPTALVDMAGSASIRRSVHEHFGERVVCSCLVGATHWDAGRARRELPGATPTFFFAPAQVAKRDEEWGPGELLRRAFAESMRIATEMRGHLEIDVIRGAAECRAALDAMVAGATPPGRGRMLSLSNA
jgi:hypothetical protein